MWSTVNSRPARNPVSLHTKTGEKISFTKFINQIKPAQDKYWYTTKMPLYNGDLQTFWASRKEFDINVHWYGRRIFQYGKEKFAVDYVVPEEDVFDVAYSPEGVPRPFPIRTRYFKQDEVEKLDDATNTRPLLISVHGLAGGSCEPYIRAAITEVQKVAPEFEHCVITARGCNRTPLGTPQFFNAAWTDDLRKFVDHVSTTQPKRPIYLVGYSLGAGILANYLGQEGANSKVTAACIVAAPWDLNLSNYILESSFMGRNVYTKAMGANLARLTNYQKDVIKDTWPYSLADWTKKGVVTKSIWEYDNTYNSAAFGFDSAEDYYRHASPVNRLRNIRTPSLVLCSQDDPICSDKAVPYQELSANGYVHTVSTTGGGHLGWYQADGKRWYTGVIAHYLKNMHEQVDAQNPCVRTAPPKRWFENDRYGLNPAV